MAELVTNASLQTICGFRDIGTSPGEQENAWPKLVSGCNPAFIHEGFNAPAATFKLKYILKKEIERRGRVELLGHSFQPSSQCWLVSRSGDAVLCSTFSPLALACARWVFQLSTSFALLALFTGQFPLSFERCFSSSGESCAVLLLKIFPGSLR